MCYLWVFVWIKSKDFPNNDISDIFKLKQESVRNSILWSYTTKRAELIETVVGYMLLEFDGVIDVLQLI